MAGERKLIVQIVGDDKALQAAFTRSAAATKKFSADVGRSGVSVAGSFAPLRAEVDKMQDKTAALQQQLAGVGAAPSQGLGAVVAKAGLATIAISALYSGSQRLSKSLQTTGAEAFTTSGRLKNLGAALAGGDIIGGIQALAATPKTLDELGISTLQATNRLEALQVVAHGFKGPMDESNASFVKFNEATKEAGTTSPKLAQELVNVTAALQGAENAANALADANSRMGQSFVTASGQVTTFKGAVDDLGGLRGPGLANQINTNLAAARGGFGQQISPEAANTAAQTVAAAAGNLTKLLSLQKGALARAKEARANSNAVGKEFEALNQAVATAQAAVIGTERQIKANADAQSKAAKAAADAAASAAKAAADAAARAKAANIQEHWNNLIRALSLDVSRAELTPALQNDLDALLALKRGLESQIKAGVDALAAQERLVSVIGAIAAKRAAIRKQAQDAIQRAQFRALGLSATGQERTPTQGNLLKQTTALLGRDDLTSKLRGRLERIKKVLTDPFHEAKGDVLSTVKGMIDGVRDELNKGGKGPLTKTTSLNTNALLAGLGLDPDAERQLRARLSTFNSAGRGLPGDRSPNGFFTDPTRNLTVTVVSTLDGEVVARSTTKQQQKTQRRNPKAKRGGI